AAAVAAADPQPQALAAPTAPPARVTPSAAVVTWEPAPLDETPATWGRKQTAIKALSFGLVKPKPGREELAHRENERLIRSANWPRSVRVVVANPKGGSGKTPVSLVLGGAMARVRGGNVAVWDAADAPGTLHVVAEGTATRCVAEIAADPDGYAYPGTIAAVATTQTTGADALVSLSDREFNGDTVARIQWALDRTYRVSIADTGNVSHSSAFRQVIASADILVIPTVIQQASVDSALRLLHRLQGSSDLVQRAVVAVLHTGAPHTPGLAAAIDGLFQNAGVEQPEHIPFDRHIAASSTITYDRLSRPSQLAWTRLATATVANITTA
uniref:MinD/ParA family ATP-binding protein n=1 Tax=Micromonospora sp. TaxID=1876 RepID=UPI003B3BE4FE